MPDKQLKLIADAEGQKPVPKDFDLVTKLLEEVTSLTVISDFLKSKTLPFSAGSWEELRSKRLLPFLWDEKLTMEDLKGLLGEAEEFGGAHTFIFDTTREKAKELLKKERIEEIGRAHV